MKITEYLYCTLICMCLLKAANGEISRDKNSLLQFERELLDDLTAEKTIKPKRPFCNAFTGCGRFGAEEKRQKKKVSRAIDLRDLQDFRATNDNIRFPISLYRALLNAAKQNNVGRDEYDYRLQQMPQNYFSD
ncbi:uncharacterized protein LOC109854531 [Pseudomyrmex gracilis]|uniref:uncharacterized protein LOC109854531 n=1 Tax=Pseudomyrmex gracilis TaxID=219809 RepID=UPI000994F356|nr:uncharacterized protein LOC109854531 [Pseudomyrmex gracilis]